MKDYGIYQELGELTLVCVVEADSRDQAVNIARKLGYGKEYRIEEMNDWR